MNPRPANNTLPRQPTTFVGRETELADLSRMLTDPACRLVTITGPGGGGKTRLALEVAARVGAAFADGVAFVPLAAITEAEQLPTALLAALDGARPGVAAPRDQLLDLLARRELLLVADNLEQLPDATDLLAAILECAPGVTILATSRAALRLRAEWLFPLAGLTLPADDTPGALIDSEAARLFSERATRGRRDFDAAREGAGVARICRLTGGLPLALELAASWTRTLPCAAIADELARNLSFLATDLRDLPARHRSVRAVFDRSWAILTGEEQAVLARLAVFQGGFRREAAEWVAGASLPILTALLDQSLLRREADGRFELHELVRQYAADQLGAAAAPVQQAHCDYYLGFAAAQFDAIVGGGQQGAVAAIVADFANLRLAWSHLAGSEDSARLYRAAHVLYLACDIRGQYHEGIALEEALIARLRAAAPTPQVERTLAACLVDLGWLRIRTGELADARVALDEARALDARLRSPLPPGLATDPLLPLGVLALIAGEYEGAAGLAAAAYRRAVAEGHRNNPAYAWYILSAAAAGVGQAPSARHYAEQALAAATAAGDRWFLAYCLLVAGDAALALDALTEARGYYAAAYTLREEFADREGMASALNALGNVALREGAAAAARSCYERSRAIYDEIGDRGGLVAAQHGLGAAAVLEGDAGLAREWFARALALAASGEFRQLALVILTSVGALLIRDDPRGIGETLLAFAARHPASDRETRDRATRALANRPPVVDTTPEVEPADLPQIVAVARAALVLSPEPGGTADVGATRAGHRPAIALIEPLTARELAVLRLIAAGRSDRAIAEELSLAVPTVKWHARHLYEKLQVRGRTEAVARARELGLLD